jgi:hypothetical protein
LALFAAIRRCHAGCTPGVVSLMSSLARTKERSNAASIRCNKHSHPDQRHKSERHKSEARNLIGVIGNDKAKIQTHCQIVDLTEQLDQAVQEKDSQKAKALVKKIAEFE